MTARKNRNDIANEVRGLPPLKWGDVVWKKVESVLKVDPIWSKEVFYIIKGPYEIMHYDIKTPLGKIIRVARDQIKLAIVSDTVTTDFISLEQFLETFDFFNRSDWENFKISEKGKPWVSNARFSFKNLQLICPKSFRNLNGNDLKKFYNDDDSFKSLIAKIAIIKKFVSDIDYRNKLLKPGL